MHHPSETRVGEEAVVDPREFEGWDFDELNEDARRLRRLSEQGGFDATASALEREVVVVVDTGKPANQSGRE